MVTTPPARHPFGGRWARFGPVGLLLVVAAGFFALGLHQAWLDSPTFDEPVYVSAGLAAVLHHDVTYNDEHPLLPKVVAVLPVLFTHPVVPANGHWDSDDERAYSATFLDAQRRAGLLRSVTLASRVIPLLEAAGLAFVLYALGRDLFGRGAGTLAGLLWLLSPFVLGLGHLDALDVSFALATALWSWALLRWLREQTTRRTVVLGLATAAAVLTDVTGLILVAIAAFAVLGAGWRGSRRRALRQSALVFLVTWASVWVLYAAFDPRVLLDPTVIAPAPYLHGIAYLARNDTVGAPGYLFGAAWNGGRWWYWPGALVAKTVPTTLLVLIVGPIAWRTLDRPTRRQAALVLAAPALFLLAFTVLTPRDIGVRYLLPVLALWLVAAGPIVGLALRSAAGEWLLAGAVAISAVALVLSSPDSLSWVAPPFAPAYRSLTNSDVDWGQGLYRLADWSAGKDPYVAYFGPRGLGAQPIAGARPLLGTDPSRLRGWVAVSATDLTSQDFSQLAWLRAYCPVGQLGGSILLYRFERPPSAAPGPARPAGLCAAGGEVSVRVAGVPTERAAGEAVGRPPTGGGARPGLLRSSF